MRSSSSNVFNTRNCVATKYCCSTAASSCTHGDSWTYKYGTIEQVFSQIFSCLQGKFFNLKFHRSQAYAFVSFAHSSLIAAPSFTDNFSDLSPRVKEALANRPLVPVGSSFVKANRLFFRLSKDLAPFFYEVPRGKFKLVYIRISNVA
jgi:hypothetical protein